MVVELVKQQDWTMYDPAILHSDIAELTSQEFTIHTTSLGMNHLPKAPQLVAIYM